MLPFERLFFIILACLVGLLVISFGGSRDLTLCKEKVAKLSALKDKLVESQRRAAEVDAKTKEQLNGRVQRQAKNHKLQPKQGAAKVMQGVPGRALRAAKIAAKWDAAHDTFPKGGAWHQHPRVTSEYTKRLAAPHATLVTHLSNIYGQMDRCLSVGCGDGGIEIEMVAGNLCKSMKGVDLSPVRVDNANKKIPDYLKDKIEFKVEDAERDTQGGNYDLVLFTHALHHIFDLESMVIAVRDKLLSETGILVLEEYVGAVRWQFPQHQLDLMASFLRETEARYPHRAVAIRQNPLWDGITFSPPDAAAVERDDPSETVRSDEIVSVLASHGMRLLENNPLGGNFFQWIFHNAYNSLLDDEGTEIVASMLNTEMDLIASGQMQSDYVFQVWTRE